MTQDDITSLSGLKVTIAPGATLAYLVTPVNGESGSILKYYSGGSLEIVEAPASLNGATAAQTWTGASLVNLQSIGRTYLMGNGETVNVSGSPRYYLMATGATTIAYLLNGLTSGY